jgi:signal transduction histidine kinase/phage shock protein PspC (stress-responsive transcriptional regulator)
MVAGVAGGLADTLGVSDAFVRAAFVTLGMVWGLGALIYVGLWLMAIDRVDDVEPVPAEPSQMIGLGLAFTGLMLLLGFLGWWPSNALVLTVAAISFGLAAVSSRDMPSSIASFFDPNATQPGRWRLLIGVGLLIGGLAILSTNVGPLLDVGPVLLAVALTLVGILVAFGPLVNRLARDLGAERRERIRQEERAELAAHLHDSVLQTLALIQRTDDPARMTILARHQENELRDWLYGNAPLDGADLVSTALKGAATRIESDHQVPIDVVTVGDHPVDEQSRVLVSAASEALVNAAKHSGADRLSLYFEAEEDQLSVFVTDHGKGFDQTAVPKDRKGITQSIVGRVERAGGTVEINSDSGEGTEVILRMPVSAE